MSVVVGIDVGGDRKGFHAVALSRLRNLELIHSTNHSEIVRWVKSIAPAVIAIDAPCRWAVDGSRSRAAERELHRAGIHCFFSPDFEGSNRPAKKNWNFGWIKQARKLYEDLERDFPLFEGAGRGVKTTIETFPHGVASVLAGQRLSGKTKVPDRRRLLHSICKIDETQLPNIDFVDAALCAYAAESFFKGTYQAVGNKEEGFIVLPAGVRRVGVSP